MRRKEWTTQDTDTLAAQLWIDLSSSQAREKKWTVQLTELNFTIFKLTNGLNSQGLMKEDIITQVAISITSSFMYLGEFKTQTKNTRHQLRNSISILTTCNKNTGKELIFKRLQCHFRLQPDKEQVCAKLALNRLWSLVVSMENSWMITIYSLTIKEAENQRKYKSKRTWAWAAHSHYSHSRFLHSETSKSRRLWL